MLAAHTAAKPRLQVGRLACSGRVAGGFPALGSRIAQHLCSMGNVMVSLIMHRWLEELAPAAYYAWRVGDPSRGAAWICVYLSYH